jgi:hypothetical protein
MFFFSTPIVLIFYIQVVLFYEVNLLIIHNKFQSLGMHLSASTAAEARLLNVTIIAGHWRFEKCHMA